MSINRKRPLFSIKSNTSFRGPKVLHLRKRRNVKIYFPFKAYREMPKYWMSSHQQDFKSCFSFRLHVLAAKGKDQETDFGKKNPKHYSLPLVNQTQTTFELSSQLLIFLNSDWYLSSCILVYSTVAQKCIGKNKK